MSTPVFEMVRTDVGTLKPIEDAGRERLGKLMDGELCLVTVRQPRRIRFHRKGMSLLQLAFNQWNPEEKSLAGMPAKKAFDVFRKELTIQAGYYEVVLGLDGQPRLEAQSLSFDRMEEAKFQEVYEALVQVLLAGILTGMSRDDVERMRLAVLEGGY